VHLETGRSRLELGEHLLAQAGEVAIGLDFGFSFPTWYLDQLALRSAPELWAHVAQHGEAWLAACEPPFWGRRGHARPVVDGPAWRRTEVAAPRHDLHALRIEPEPDSGLRLEGRIWHPAWRSDRP
jgi:hypothetical protein